MDRSHNPVVLSLLQRFGNVPLTGAELGVHKAQLSRHLLEALPLLTLYLVDTWAVYERVPELPHRQRVATGANAGSRDRHYRVALENLAPFGKRATVVRMTTVGAASLFTDGSFDFVFIDAGHDRPSLEADLAAWWPKVRVGGLFFGHDYGRGNSPEVKPVMDEWAAKTGRKLELLPGTVWAHWKGQP